MAVLIAVAFVAVVFVVLIPEAVSVIQSSLSWPERGGGSFYLNPVLKTIGVAYVTSFGVQICQEAGEDAIASVLELAGKLVILFIGLPLLQAIVHTLFGILGL